MKAKKPDSVPPALPPPAQDANERELVSRTNGPLGRRCITPLAPPPPPPPQLTRLHAIERAAETVRFALVRLEYWLSPGGHLRECLRLGLWLWCVLSMVGVFVAPALTSLLTQATTWTGLLAQIVHNLMLLPLGIGAFLLSMAGVLLVFRVLSRR